MELQKKFDNVDVLPIGEDVRHLDEPNDNIINMITAVYLRDSLEPLRGHDPCAFNVD